MAPTVTLHFKGDTDRLRQSVSAAKDEVNNFKTSTMGSLGAVALGFGALAGAAASAGVIAGAALVSVPAGFMGIGIAAAAQSEKVKASFTSMSDHIGKRVQEMNKPMEGVLIGLMDRAKQKFDEVSPSLQGLFDKAAPMVDTLGNSIINFVANAMPGFDSAMRGAQPVIDQIAIGIENMSPAFNEFFAIMEANGPQIADSFKKLFEVINWLIPKVAEVLAWLMQYSHIIVPLALTVAGFAVAMKALSTAISFAAGVMQVIRIAILGWKAAQALLNIVMMANPFTLIVIAIIALVAIIIYAWNNCETFRNIVKDVWAKIKEYFNSGVEKVKSAINWFQNIPKYIDRYLKIAQAYIGLWITIIGNYFRELPGKIMSALGNLGSTLYNSGVSLVRGFWDGIRATWDWLVGQVKGLMGGLRNLWPFSPAKDGPFSGRGYVTYSGKALMTDFGKGIISGADSARRAAENALGTVSPAFTMDVAAGMRPGNVGSGGSVTNVYVQGSIRSDKDLVKIIRDEAFNGGFRGAF